MTSPNIEKTTEVTLDGRVAHEVRDWVHTSRLLACRVDPTGRFVFAGSTDRTVQRWEIASGNNTTLVGHDNWVRTLGCSPDGATLYSGGYDGRLIFWDAAAAKPQPTRTIEAHKGWLRALAVSSDGQWIATGGNDRMVKIWSSQDGHLVREFTPTNIIDYEVYRTKQIAEGHFVREFAEHPQFIFSLAFHPSSHELVSGDLLGNIHHWNVETGQLVRKFDARELHFDIGDWSHNGGILGLFFSVDHKIFSATGLHKQTNALANGQEGVGVVFDWESGKKLRKQERLKNSEGSTMWRGVYHSSGQFIGGLSNDIGFWMPGEEDLYYALKTKSPIFDMDLHPNQIDLFTAHFDGHLRTLRLQPKPTSPAAS
jgi:WD40 repeat protein